MPQSLKQPSVATPRESLADVRGYGVKAELKPELPASELRDVAANALRRVTSQKAAAVDIGIHEGRLSHKLSDGSLTLAQLETLGPTFAAEFARQLAEHYSAHLEAPTARIRRLLRAMRAHCDEIDQAADYFEK